LGEGIAYRSYPRGGDRLEARQHRKRSLPLLPLGVSTTGGLWDDMYVTPIFDDVGGDRGANPAGRRNIPPCIIKHP